MFDRAVRWLTEHQRWVYPVLIALWIAAGTYMITSPKVALPDTAASPTARPASMLSLSQPKTVTYEVSSGGKPITVSYLDEKGQSKLFTGAAPWRTSVTTNDFGFAAGITALSADTVTCRITVDGKVADEKTDTGRDPSVSCNLVAFQKLEPVRQP
ncbi:putative membrane protein mmpS4 [Mycobacteroides salmoniphilum]|uniref:Putative membrane protein mmpS4 n=1 Tax=Mycobacteroides salmoniphilum TaxID=404941 RepID=A0A4R8RUY3_9MYCO|nr:MmpS family transport accessory protein [Mycobacteroides salmoniphilum]TDZ76200.1 putative membrane protein mmpS4 [Mycobacteroides salmoniphilum]TDZ78196.1 putative membrane protein mmpS4 [Mycobacteroides salmoniphilum]TDZ84718.1 putative membrane protein mmpS4 [Mycobacteroides salmoniphilum]